MHLTSCITLFLPTHRWFNFEKIIEALVAKGTYHMDSDRLLKVTRKACQIDDKEEMTAMLNFYHDLGVIVKHGRTVVLQAQWLIDLFKRLITVRPFDEIVSKVYSCLLQTLEISRMLGFVSTKLFHLFNFLFLLLFPYMCLLPQWSR